MKHILFVYPNDLFDYRVENAIEITKKYQQCQVHIFPKQKNYSEISNYFSNEIKEQTTGVVISNHKGGIMEEVSKEFKNINWIQALGTGIDKIIQCDQVKNNDKIVLCNLKSVSDILLAEFAIGGMLYFAKNFPYFNQLTDKKEWRPLSYQNTGELYNKTALIVGLGSIGSMIAKKCKYGFDMNIIGIKRDTSKNIDKLKQYVDKFFGMSELKQLVSQSDFIINCLPTLQGVNKVYTKEIFENMKKNSIFVNVSRGQAVDEIELEKALENGTLKGAALDVFEQEPMPKAHPFYNNSKIRDKLLMTCHAMDSGPQYLEKMCELYDMNLKNYLENHELNGIISKKFGY